MFRMLFSQFILSLIFFGLFCYVLYCILLCVCIYEKCTAVHSHWVLGFGSHFHYIHKISPVYLPLRFQSVGFCAHKMSVFLLFIYFIWFSFVRFSFLFSSFHVWCFSFSLLLFLSLGSQAIWLAISPNIYTKISILCFYLWTKMYSKHSLKHLDKYM